MLSEDTLRQLDFPCYARILTRLLGGAANIAVCCPTGECIWSNVELSDRINKYLRDIVVSNADEAGERENNANESGSDSIAVRLEMPSGEIAGSVVVLREAVDAVAQDTRSALEDVASLMNADLQRIIELDAMAEELSGRYEELNLLCATAQTDYRAKNECRDSLSQAIRECATHMGLDLVVLWVEQRKALFPAGSLYRHDDQELKSWLERLAKVSFDWFVGGKDMLALNSGNDPVRDVLGIDGQQKILGVPLRDGRGNVCGVLVCANGKERADFTNGDRRLLEAVVERISECIRDQLDDLTGVLSRSGFKSYIDRLTKIEADEPSRWVFCLANIEQFKVINAAYGMQAGDEVLREVGKKLADCVGGRGAVGRLEADSFGVMMTALSVDQAEAFVQSFVNEVESLRFRAMGRGFAVSLRVGVVELSLEHDGFDRAIASAEIALATARNETGSKIEIYRQDDVVFAARKNEMRMVESIRQALSEDRFILYSQRIQPLSGDRVHYELLIRMLNESGEIMAPGLFLGVAEQYNLMRSIDQWVVRNAFGILGEFSARLCDKSISWGINLSGQSLSSMDFRDYLSQKVHENIALSRNIYFEITETTAVQNFKLCVEFMRTVQSMGYKFALDDFGSGLSSFTYLKNLPVDYLKIDGGLVRDMRTNKVDQAMVLAISQVARELGLTTIAEFVEDAETMDLLERIGIDYAQGYHVMKPCPLGEELERLSCGRKEECSDDAEQRGRESSSAAC